MEELPGKYQPLVKTINTKSNLPLPWIHHFLDSLYRTNQKYTGEIPSEEAWKDLYETDIDFMMILSKVLMDFMMDMEPLFYIPRIDTYIRTYRTVMRHIYTYSSFSYEQAKQLESILNIS
jgi:hypothetical protein